MNDRDTRVIAKAIGDFMYHIHMMRYVTGYKATPYEELINARLYRG